MLNVKREAVKRGAQLLDELVPGWHRRIDLERLEMTDINLCILGQLFGYEAELALGKELYPELWDAFNKARGCGYGIGSSVLGSLVGVTDSQSYNRDICGAPEGTDARFLAEACSEGTDKCTWAEEIAERLAKDEANE